MPKINHQMLEGIHIYRASQIGQAIDQKTWNGYWRDFFKLWEGEISGVLCLVDGLPLKYATDEDWNDLKFLKKLEAAFTVKTKRSPEGRLAYSLYAYLQLYSDSLITRGKPYDILKEYRARIHPPNSKKKKKEPFVQLFEGSICVSVKKKLNSFMGIKEGWLDEEEGIFNDLRLDCVGSDAYLPFFDGTVSFTRYSDDMAQSREKFEERKNELVKNLQEAGFMIEHVTMDLTPVKNAT